MFKNYSRKHDMKSLKQTKRFRINLEDTEITKTNKYLKIIVEEIKSLMQAKYFEINLEDSEIIGTNKIFQN